MVCSLLWSMIGECWAFWTPSSFPPCTYSDQIYSSCIYLLSYLAELRAVILQQTVLKAEEDEGAGGDVEEEGKADAKGGEEYGADRISTTEKNLL